MVNNNPSLVYQLKIGPIIQSITPISYKGGIITISGYRLMVNESLSVKVGTQNCTSPTQIEYPRSFYCNLDSMMDDSMVNVSVSVSRVESDPFSYNIIEPYPTQPTSSAPYLKMILPRSIGGVILLLITTLLS